MARGGARPGAGRKSKKTESYQATMRAIFEDVVTRDRWENVVTKALEDAENGSKDARAWLTPWIVGGASQEVKVKGGDSNESLNVVVRYVGGDKDDRAS